MGWIQPRKLFCLVCRVKKKNRYFQHLLSKVLCRTGLSGTRQQLALIVVSFKSRSLIWEPLPFTEYLLVFLYSWALECVPAGLEAVPASHIHGGQGRPERATFNPDPPEITLG